VNGSHIPVIRWGGRRLVEHRVKAARGKPTKQARASRRSKHFRLAGRPVVRIRPIHELHDGPKVATSLWLNTLSKKFGSLPAPFHLAGFARQIPRVESANFATAWCAGPAAQAWLRAGTTAAAVAALALECHEGFSRWLVRPINGLSRLQFWRVASHVVKLHKYGMTRSAAAPRARVRLLLNNHDSLVGLVIEYVVHVRLFDAPAGSSFHESDALLNEERIHSG